MTGDVAPLSIAWLPASTRHYLIATPDDFAVVDLRQPVDHHRHHHHHGSDPSFPPSTTRSTTTRSATSTASRPFSVVRSVPFQPHHVVTGGAEDGIVACWDMRLSNGPRGAAVAAVQVGGDHDHDHAPPFSYRGGGGEDGCSIGDVVCTGQNTVVVGNTAGHVVEVDMMRMKKMRMKMSSLDQDHRDQYHHHHQQQQQQQQHDRHLMGSSRISRIRASLPGHAVSHLQIQPPYRGGESPVACCLSTRTESLHYLPPPNPHLPFPFMEDED